MLEANRPESGRGSQRAVLVPIPRDLHLLWAVRRIALSPDSRLIEGEALPTFANRLAVALPALEHSACDLSLMEERYLEAC